MNLNMITNDFLAHCQARGLSPHTIRAYRQDMRDLTTWIIRAEHKLPFTKDIVLHWIEDMRARSLAPASIKRRLACLKVLCRWLENEGLHPDNPFHSLRTPIRLPKRLPRNLTRSELKTLFGRGGPRCHTSSDIKHATLRLAIELLFSTGVRIGELCGIRLQDVDLASGIIAIRGKGNRERRVFLADEQIKALIIDYMARRRDIAPVTDVLLLTPHATAATPDYIRKHLHEHAEALTMPRRITPHMLRHTAATQLLESGVDIRFVQKLLGHASISTTEIYTHVSDQSLQKAIRAANPRRRI